MKVLLVIDGSSYSPMSVKMAKALRLSRHANITVMTVVPEYKFIGGITLGMLRGEAITPGGVRKVQEKKAQALIEGYADELRTDGAGVETAVVFGEPDEQIIKTAAGLRADLIIMGAKGASDSRRETLGSVAQRVMRFAGCSVLLVREGPSDVRLAFLAVDGSDYSRAAARFLLEMPLPAHSQVTVLTALHSHSDALANLPALDLKSEGNVLEELQKVEEQTARGIMSETRKQFEEKGYEALSWLLRGEPAEEIMVAAGELHPELIVMGAKGLSDLGTFPIGSTVQEVARLSRYSVLIGRPAG